MSRPNLKLSEETGEETRNALKKYKNAYELGSQEEAIRELLPEWAFNPLVSQEMGRLKDIVDKSRHYNVDFSQMSEKVFQKLASDIEETNPELASEIQDTISQVSSKN